MSVTKAIRKARKNHRCDSCGSSIKAGEAYLTHTALAGDDYYDDARDRDTFKPANCPIRINECAECATRYGRADLLTEPTTTTGAPQ